MNTKQLFKDLILSLNKESNETDSQKMRFILLVILNKLRRLNDDYDELLNVKNK
jgi:uncharacterized protein YsxB (DUF464 family)